MIAVRAIASGLAGPTTLFVQGMSHCVAAQPPRTGIVPIAMPISVRHSSGGQNTLGTSTFVRDVARSHRQPAARFGHHGPDQNADKNMGVAHTRSSHRHESGVAGV